VYPASPATRRRSVTSRGRAGDHSGGRAMRTLARTHAVRPPASRTAGKRRAVAPSRPPTTTGRVAVARLRTRAVTVTSAPPWPSRRVTTPGASSSAAPSRRTVTSRLIPPKLNHDRCQAAAFIASGERQSARTTSTWRPGASRTRASKGR
jgi:hypothetical protein